MIIEQVMVGPMAVFCYILGDKITGEALLIDPAANFDKISSVVKNNNLRISGIINTHGHFDHTSGNRFFVKKYKSSLFIHELDAPMLKSGINRMVNFIKGGRGTSLTMKFVKDGDLINIGSKSIEVIHTPGHTPGSICLLWKNNLFTGDTLFTEGMGRTDFKGGNEKDIIDSIRHKILSFPDDTVIWPGHNYGRFPVSTVKEQKKFYF